MDRVDTAVAGLTRIPELTGSKPGQEPAILTGFR
jgi:hypothetical protein